VGSGAGPAPRPRARSDGFLCRRPPRTPPRADCSVWSGAPAQVDRSLPRHLNGADATWTAQGLPDHKARFLPVNHTYARSKAETIKTPKP
jgi:hypothetical protein